jgi:hypothetical protein
MQNIRKYLLKKIKGRENTTLQRNDRINRNIFIKKKTIKN